MPLPAHYRRNIARAKTVLSKIAKAVALIGIPIGLLVLVVILRDSSLLRVVLALLYLVPLFLLWLFFVFAEYLDWHGRMDTLERKHPKIWRLINDRVFRLVILLLV